MKHWPKKVTYVGDLKKWPTSKKCLGYKSKWPTGHWSKKKHDSSHYLYQYFGELTCGFILSVCGLEVRPWPQPRRKTAQNATARRGRPMEGTQEKDPKEPRRGPKDLGGHFFNARGGIKKNLIFFQERLCTLLKTIVFHKLKV